MTPRARRLLYYGVPILFCLAVHFNGLRTWFYQDDFAWLGTSLEFQGTPETLSAIFGPRAQGTMRFLSERLFYVLFSGLFGLEAPPFRIWVFLTQIANLVLLIQITQRLSGSILAGSLAAVIWIANSSLGMPMAWTAAYNQIAVVFFLLLAFRLLLLHIDTAQTKYWIWQWVVFLLGFGAQELIAAYPVLAAGYTYLFARKYFRKTLPLFLPSAAYTLAHIFWVPHTADEHYRMYFDASVLHTFWLYWRYIVSSMQDQAQDWRPVWLQMFLTSAASAALALFVIRRSLRRDWLPLFALLWFLVVLAPLLPLRNHFTPYYPAAASIALALLAGYALSQSRGWTRAAAGMLTAVYLVFSVWEVHAVEKYVYRNSRRMKYLVKGLETLSPLERHKTVLMRGIDDELFWSGFRDDPFRLLGIKSVFLAPGTEASIDPHWDTHVVQRYSLDRAAAARLLNHRQAIVLQFETPELRDVTDVYRASLASQAEAAAPNRIDVADPGFADLLGKDWYPPEQGFRWMPRTATFKIRGPQKPGQTLRVIGFCPALLVEDGPLDFSLQADRVPLGTATVKDPDQPFDMRFPLPEALIGRPIIEVVIAVSRTTHVPGDRRPLGLVFQTFIVE